MRRLAALALVAAGCSAGEGARYLGDRGFRRAALVSSLVAPGNGYSRLRLARYATGGDGDWDALPEWNPPVATLAADGSPRADEAALALGVDGDDDAGLVALGRAAFFRYPTQLVPALSDAFAADGGPDAFGLWSDEQRGAAGVVSARLADGSRGLALTCATCHARVDDGALVAGLPNQALRLGAIGNAGVDPWGPGRVDVAPPPGEEPVAIADLRPTALETHLHRDGTVAQADPIALAVRIETLIVTSHQQLLRPPRVVALALARYLASLAPPPLMTPPPGSAAARGAASFAAACAGCHAPPGFAGPPVPLALVGTDPRVGESAERGTGGYRVPSLRGVARRGRLLHDASIADLPSLLDPARAQPGHRFGLALDAAGRADLLAFLRAL